MDLLNLCLTSTYFQYNGKHCKQLHGTAMGSPVSVVVAKSSCKTSRNEPSQLTNEHYHSGYAKLTTPLQPYTKTKSTIFTNTSTDKEIEVNGKILFLDCLVTRDNNKLRTTIYRKPTHTDRLLDRLSYNPTSHKATTIRTLTRRAQLVCDPPDSLTAEIKYLDNVFNKNNYNRDFI